PLFRSQALPHKLGPPLRLDLAPFTVCHVMPRRRASKTIVSLAYVLRSPRTRAQHYVTILGSWQWVSPLRNTKAHHHRSLMSENTGKGWLPSRCSRRSCLVDKALLGALGEVPVGDVPVLVLERVDRDVLDVHPLRDAGLLALPDNRNHRVVVVQDVVELDEELGLPLRIGLDHRLFIRGVVLVVDVPLEVAARPVVRGLRDLFPVRA